MNTRDATMTADEVRSLPLTTDLPTAGRAIGISRDNAYRLARRGEFPVPVLRAGRRYRVTRAALLAVLGLEGATENAPDPGNSLAETESAQVSAVPTDSETAGK